MERTELIEQIQQIITKYGCVHCYENIVGNFMPPKPAHMDLGAVKVVDGIFYDDTFKNGFIQGFHLNHVTVVNYKNAKPNDTFTLSYAWLPVKYLTECLNFLRRK